MQVDGKVRWLLPTFCMMQTDWPEGQKATCVRAGATTSKVCCRCCFHPTAEFSVTENGLTYPYREARDMQRRAEYHIDRIEANVRGAIGDAEEEGMELSMWWTKSAMWKMESYTDDRGHFMQFPFDTLHTVSGGLAAMLRKILVALAKKHGTLGELDYRLSLIPVVRDQTQRNFSYRPFNTGLSSMQVFTGSDNIALLQQMHFAVSDDDGVIPDATIRRRFVAATTAVRGVAHIMKKLEVTVLDLGELDRRCAALGPLFNNLMAALPEDVGLTTDIPKLHAFLHFSDFIRLFGTAVNFDTCKYCLRVLFVFNTLPQCFTCVYCFKGTNERLHKEVVGNVLKQDCKRACEFVVKLYVVDPDPLTPSFTL